MKKILVIGEILTRISNESNNTYGEQKPLIMNFGGAEYNVACHLAYWGNSETYFFSQIAPNWFINKALEHLHSFQVRTNYVLKNEAMKKNGYYFLETGSANKVPRVIYDRQNSAFCFLDGQSALKNAINDVDVIYLSGISFAVSEITRRTLIEVVKWAHDQKKTIILDFNYRQALWDYALAKQTFETVLPYLDIALCGLKDVAYILKILDFSGSEIKDSDVKKAMLLLKSKYNNLKVIACTNRNIITTSQQEIKGYLLNENNFYQTRKHEISDVIDRIGSGDAFAAGIVDTYLKDGDWESGLDFAVRANVLKHYYYGDNAKLEKDLIENIKKKVTDVQR